MTPKEAADQLRPHFNLVSMPPEDRHHVKFVEDVAAELGVEPTPFNLYQVAEALDAAGIREDGNAYPKMLYSRKGTEGAASTYDARNKWYTIEVANDEEAQKLGPDWVSDPNILLEPHVAEAPKPTSEATGSES